MVEEHGPFDLGGLLHHIEGLQRPCNIKIIPLPKHVPEEIKHFDCRRNAAAVHQCFAEHMIEVFVVALIELLNVGLNLRVERHLLF